MIELISEMFSYTFMTRAFVSGLLLSLCASLLGTPLVLKRYSMIGDGLSHIGFGALAVAAVMNLTPLYVAIPVVSGRGRAFAQAQRKQFSQGRFRRCAHIHRLACDRSHSGIRGQRYQYRP